MAPFSYARTFSQQQQQQQKTSGGSLRHAETIDSAYKRYWKIRHSIEKATAETEKKTLLTFFVEKRSEKASY